MGVSFGVGQFGPMGGPWVQFGVPGVTFNFRPKWPLWRASYGGLSTSSEPYELGGSHLVWVSLDPWGVHGSSLGSGVPP